MKKHCTTNRNKNNNFKNVEAEKIKNRKKILKTT